MQVRMGSMGLLGGIFLLTWGCADQPGATGPTVEVERRRPAKRFIRIGASARAFVGGRSDADEPSDAGPPWRFVSMVAGRAELGGASDSPLAERQATQAAMLEALAYVCNELAGGNRPDTYELTDQIRLGIKWSRESPRPQAVELLLDDRGRTARLSEEGGRLTSPPLSSETFKKILGRLLPRVKLLRIDVNGRSGECTVWLARYRRPKSTQDLPSPATRLSAGASDSMDNAR